MVKNDVAVPVSTVPELIRRTSAACEALIPGCCVVPFGRGDAGLRRVGTRADAPEQGGARSQGRHEPRERAANAQRRAAEFVTDQAEVLDGRLIPPLLPAAQFVCFAPNRWPPVADRSVIALVGASIGPVIAAVMTAMIARISGVSAVPGGIGLLNQDRPGGRSGATQ